MSLIRKHVAVLQAWACLDLVYCSQDMTDSQADTRRRNVMFSG